MFEKVYEMLTNSTYNIENGDFLYLKAKSFPKTLNHFLISQDSDEITVVTEEKYINEIDVIEKNDHVWKLISLNLSIPFMAGTLAVVNNECAKQGLNNLIVSTYSKDYILVKQTQLDDIRKVLEINLKIKAK